MQLLVLNLFFLDHQLRTTFGLRLIDNGLGPPKYGEEETILDFALLAADQKKHSAIFPYPFYRARVSLPSVFKEIHATVVHWVKVI